MSGNEYVALASVLDKTGLPEFLQGVGAIQTRVGKKMEILSTGGTLKLLTSSGLPVRGVDDYTGFPEGLGGRLKTLHPKVHGGFLYRPGVLGDAEFLEGNSITSIDLLVVNLYDFSGAVTKFEASAQTVEDFAEVIENIDIGGPAMLRSADKGEPTVITDPNDYDRALDEMDKNEGDVTPAFQVDLKTSVFQKTSAYDRAIAQFLGQHKTLFIEYQQAKKEIIAGNREPFACWTKTH